LTRRAAAHLCKIHLSGGGPVVRELTFGDWRGYRRDRFPAESWRWDAGAFWAIPGGEGVDLLSRDRFGDFVLSFEWCLPEAGNSGVLYRVSEEYPESWQSGPEMQLVDDEHHPDAADARTLCGALYGLLAPEIRLKMQPGIFRPARIVVHGYEIEHWIDGIRVLACDLESRGLRHQIESSKFAEYPLFAAATEGHVVLQHHGTSAGFRHIQIETQGSAST
jgi:hypothetical protein